MDDIDLPHSMTYAEAEALKDFARRGRELSEVVDMIAHWMRCSIDVTFSGYASNWAAASTAKDLPAMRAQWPLHGARMIADGSTEWGTAAK